MNKDLGRKSPSNRCESNDLGQGDGLPAFVLGLIDLFSFLVSLCRCGELADFFPPSSALGHPACGSAPYRSN